MSAFVYETRAPLDFPRTLAYIGRYETAQREAVGEGVVLQVLSDAAGYFLVELRALAPRSLAATQLTGRPSRRRTALLEKFVRRSLGPDEPLLGFYRAARADPVLARLVKRFRGVRLVGVWDLWECLGWSILGQQVSVQSAFAMRARLARHAGAVVRYQGTVFEGFPTPAALLALSDDDLRACGLSRGKVDYLRSIARLIEAGSLVEDELLVLPFAEARLKLRALRGLGPWSVEYAMMRVFADPDACPIEDIGLRNALGKEYALGHQATLAETRALTDRWHPFRAYGTFYLWQTLWEQA